MSRIPASTVNLDHIVPIQSAVIVVGAGFLMQHNDEESA